MHLGVCPTVNFSFPNNSSYILHLIKLKLDIKIDHDDEQFRGYGPMHINRVMPLWKFLWTFSFWLTPPPFYIQLSWNLIYSETMMWSSAYCFEVTVHWIFTVKKNWAIWSVYMCYILLFAMGIWCPACGALVGIWVSFGAGLPSTCKSWTSIILLIRLAQSIASFNLPNDDWL